MKRRGAFTNTVRSLNTRDIVLPLFDDWYLFVQPRVTINSADFW